MLFGENSLALWLLARTARALRPLSSVFVMAGLWSGVGHDAIRATVVFNNLNSKQCVVYFRILVMVRGRSMTSRRRAESSPPGRTSAAREREAKGGLGR